MPTLRLFLAPLLLVAAGAPASAANNLTAGKPVTVSSTGKKRFDARNAVDGDEFTAWNSVKGGDAEWLAVDLQKTYTIDKARLNWTREEWGKAYEIQVSTDAKSWKSVYQTDKGPGGVEEIKFRPARARYVRFLGRTRADEYYELNEFEVYQEGKPFDRLHLDNLAARRPVTASSSRWKNFPLPNAVDARSDTFWASKPGANQWIQTDLGRPTAVTGVTLYWQNWPLHYKVRVSLDGTSWADAGTDANAEVTAMRHWEVERKDHFTFADPRRARFVRMYGTDVARGHPKAGYHLHEFVVEGRPPGHPPRPAMRR